MRDKQQEEQHEYHMMAARGRLGFSTQTRKAKVIIETERSTSGSRLQAGRQKGQWTALSLRTQREQQLQIGFKQVASELLPAGITCSDSRVQTAHSLCSLLQCFA